MLKAPSCLNPQLRQISTCRRRTIQFSKIAECRGSELLPPPASPAAGITRHGCRQGAGLSVRSNFSTRPATHLNARCLTHSRWTPLAKPQCSCCTTRRLWRLTISCGTEYGWKVKNRQDNYRQEPTCFAPYPGILCVLNLQPSGGRRICRTSTHP